MKRLLPAFFHRLLLVSGLLAAGCGDREDGPADTRDSGTIHISADESFKPVLDSEIQVFEALHPGTHIIAHYKPEGDCLRDFAVDSIRVVVATRGFSKHEEDFLNDSMKVDASRMVVAYDAVAVIVNPSSPDTLFTMQEIRDILTGRARPDLRPVFDGLSATSTVRFVMDSVLRGERLGENVSAAKSSAGVIDFVSRTPKAIGFVGVSWVGNRQDSSQLSYLQKIRVASIEHPLVPGKYVTPAQFNIYYRRYPMVRDLVYTLKEKHNGLGHAFSNFLTTQSGQLIFNRAFLMPAIMSFRSRNATVTEE
ncbi:MAG: phosphate transporter substrate-binding protein PhoT family [Flaviaesturariibacter sp.]|nr:phosphate transporter substrate-binding protein PhoT family [Flaviaesturariibacter sp.]